MSSLGKTGPDFPEPVLFYGKLLAVQHFHRLFAVGFHQVRYAGDIGAVAGQGHQLFTGKSGDAKAARAGHELLESHTELFAVVIDTDSAERDVLNLFAADDVLHILVVDKDFLHRGAELGDGIGEFAFLKPQGDVLADHARNHQGAAHADGFDERGAESQCLEDAVLAAESAGESDIRHPLAFIREHLAELIGGGVEVKAGHTPLLHHAPGTHAGAAGRAVDGKEVDFSTGAPLDSHGKLAQAVSAGFQGDALEADIAQALDLGVELLFTNKAESTVPLELLDGAVFESRLVNGVGGVRGNDKAAFLELDGPLQNIDLDFTADTLGALSPFKLDGVQLVFLVNIFRNAQTRILDVHLEEDFAVALVVAPVGLEAAVHIRGGNHFTVLIPHQLGVNTAGVFAADTRYTADSRAHGNVLPG